METFNGWRITDAKKNTRTGARNNFLFDNSRDPKFVLHSLVLSPVSRYILPVSHSIASDRFQQTSQTPSPLVVENTNPMYWLKKHFLCLLLRVRQSTNGGLGGGGQRDRETQNPKQAPGSELQHRAWHGAWTHELWDHDLSCRWTFNQMSHPA